MSCKLSKFSWGRSHLTTMATTGGCANAHTGGSDGCGGGGSEAVGKAGDGRWRQSTRYTRQTASFIEVTKCNLTANYGDGVCSSSAQRKLVVSAPPVVVTLAVSAPRNDESVATWSETVPATTTIFGLQKFVFPSSWTTDRYWLFTCSSAERVSPGLSERNRVKSYVHGWGNSVSLARRESELSNGNFDPLRRAASAAPAQPGRGW
jgi:hypothetical protein